MHLLPIKPALEAIKEAGVTMDEFAHFQNMVMKSQAAAVVAATANRQQQQQQQQQQQPTGVGGGGVVVTVRNHA